MQCWSNIGILIMGHCWVDRLPRAGPCLQMLILTLYWPSVGTFQGHYIISDVGPTPIITTLVQYWLWDSMMSEEFLTGGLLLWHHKLRYKFDPLCARYMFKGQRKLMNEIQYLKVSFTV